MNMKPRRRETLHLIYVGDEPLREIPARCKHFEIFIVM
jgi:hypothetical protein